MDFSQHITIINEEINKEIEGGNRIRFISSDKWKQMMLKILLKLRKKELYDSLLIDDFITVVKNIPEQNFLEAVIHIQPFKPNFIKSSKASSISKGNIQESDHDLLCNSRYKIYDQQGRAWLSNIFKFKQEIHGKLKDSIFFIQELNHKNTLLQSTLSLIIEEQTLSKQFQAHYHPFRRVIDQFVFLLEHKYKNYISNHLHTKIQTIQEMILFDVNLLQEFIIRSSVPYLQIFKSKNVEERLEFQIELIGFIKKYLENHNKINPLIRKIIKFALKRSPQLEASLEKIPCFLEIDKWSIERDFKINGQYFYATNSLIEFAQSQQAGNSLKKLQELRDSILKDIYLFHQNSSKQACSREEDCKRPHENRSLKLSVENQLQILKFLVCKARIFIVDILAELKYLQIVLGEQQISYKYDDSSFMYAQLMVAIDIVLLENS